MQFHADVQVFVTRYIHPQLPPPGVIKQAEPFVCHEEYPISLISLLQT
jgi:hypothetical protein